MTKFKEGDVVRFMHPVTGTGWDSPTPIGTVGVIKSVDDKEPLGQWYKVVYFVTPDDWENVLEQELEHAG